MKSNLFVFIGLFKNNSQQDLSSLQRSLNDKFYQNSVQIKFTRKDELLLARSEDTSFYISFLKTEKDLKDWFKMAKNFELVVEKKPVNKKGLINRYEALKRSSSNVYKNSHYEIGIAIMEEIEKLSDLIVYSFQ